MWHDIASGLRGPRKPTTDQNKIFNNVFRNTGHRLLFLTVTMDDIALEDENDASQMYEIVEKYWLYQYLN